MASIILPILVISISLLAACFIGAKVYGYTKNKKKVLRVLFTVGAFLLASTIFAAITGFIAVSQMEFSR